MKRLCTGLFRLALLSLISLLPPVQAQAQTADRSAAPSSYDVSREVTLNGTVSAVLRQGSAGMILGPHLLLTTLSGPVDASLGRWGLRGKGALSVAPGQQVEVTGVMKTLRDKQVFLARTVKVGDRVYTMRNEHGIPVSPQTRKRAGEITSQTGGSL
jgi:hypothetical protein